MSQNLAKTWKEYQLKRGKTVTAALAELNEAMDSGRNYQAANLSRWTRGERRPDGETRAFMLDAVMADELCRAFRQIRERVEGGFTEEEAVESVAPDLAERLS